MTVIRHIEIKNVYKIVSHGQKINIGIGGFYDNQCLSVCLLPDYSIYIRTVNFFEMAQRLQNTSAEWQVHVIWSYNEQRRQGPR